ncbi:MAG: Major Facilitator Superfamily protein [Verrucomicrobiales bacterium]|nr:Major Facilitator Superfamily protein [Verrucomicrobiales bacterium]
MSAPTSSTPATTSVGNPSSERGISGFISRFTVLKGATRELWLIFLIKFLSITAYSITNKTFVLWLSSDFGYGDKSAVGMVGLWAMAMTGMTIMIGALADAIGLRKSLLLGMYICIIARVAMVFGNVKWLALGVGLFPLAIGEALAGPILVAATRRYSTTAQRSISFSMLYMIMNLAFLTAGYVFDWLRSGLGEHGHFDLFGMHISTYRALFLVSLGFEVALLPITYCLRKNVEVTDEGCRINPEKPKYPGASFLNSFWFAVRDSAKDTFNLFAGLLQQSAFYRLLAFLGFIGFLKIITVGMDYVFPKFGIRELGDGAPIGHLLNINNLMIVLLVPIFGALTQRFAAYRMVIIGGTICAASVFIMALPTNWFVPLANGAFGNFIHHRYLGMTGPVHPYYVMIAIYVIIFSVGEACYSPRVYEYAAAIAPKGQEASYSALSYIPLFLGKLLVANTGFLLLKYCPENGPRNSGMMWLVFALCATVAPIGLLTLRSLIRVREAGRES